jgi:hypothetical protein
MLSNLFRKLVLLGSIGVLLGGAASVRAGAIVDDAGLFSPKALEKANAEIAKIEKESHHNLTIETLATVPNGRADEVAKMSSRGREEFFDAWARERAISRKAQGEYVLITKNPGHVQIEVDRQTRNSGFGVAQRSTLRDNFIAGFKKKDYDRGLLDAVEYARSALHSGHGTARRNENPAAVPHRPADHRGVGAAPGVGGGMGLFGWAIVIGAVFLGIRLLSGLFHGMSGGAPAGGYGGGGGGGMFGSLLTGMFGAMAGHWLYDSFFSGHHGGSSAFGGDSYDQGSGNDGAGQDFEGTGGDFGDSGSSGGDFGGGDSGGGDFGGGDFGGGDFGGGGDF